MLSWIVTRENLISILRKTVCLRHRGSFEPAEGGQTLSQCDVPMTGMKTFSAAYNLANYGLMSNSQRPESELSPTEYREPLPIRKAFNAPAKTPLDVRHVLARAQAFRAGVGLR